MSGGSVDDPVVIDVSSDGSTTLGDYEYDPTLGFTGPRFLKFIGLAPMRMYHFAFGDHRDRCYLYADPGLGGADFRGGITEYTQNNNLGIRNTKGDTAWWTTEVSYWDFGTQTLTWSSDDPPPAGPYTWDTAEVITGTSGSTEYSGVGSDLYQRFYSYTPTTNATVKFWANEPDNYIEVYSGDSWDSPTWLDDGWSDSSGNPVEYAILSSPTPGTTYHIVAYNYDYANTFTLSWTGVSAAPYIVSNDDFTAATPIDLGAVGSSGSHAYDNTGATSDDSATNFTDQPRSIWYSFSATAAANVRFAATPGSSDISAKTSMQVFKLNPTTSQWDEIGQGFGPQRDNQVIAALVAGGDYRLMLSFPYGDPGTWDAAGTFTWHTTAPASNSTVETATVATQQTLVSNTAQGGQDRQWYTITAPIDGGMFIVLGDAAAPPLSSAYAADAMVYAADGTTYLGDTRYRSTAAPTAAFIREVKAGDTFKVKVEFQYGTSSDVVLRWGISSQVIWGDWQDSSQIRPGGTQAPLRPWGQLYFTYQIAYGNELDSGANSRWGAAAETATAEYTDPSDFDFIPARALIDSGHGQRADQPQPPANVNALGGGTQTSYGEWDNDTTPDAHAGVGYSGRFQQGPQYWVESPPLTGVGGASMALNEVEVANIAYDLEMVRGDDYVGWDAYMAAHQPIIWQAGLNGLVPPGGGAYVSPAQIADILRTKKVEWADGEGRIQVNLYARIEVDWTRSSGSPWIGSVSHAPPDPFTLQLRESAFPLQDLRGDWLSPEKLSAMPVVYEFTVPTDAGETGTYRPTQDSDFVLWESDVADKLPTATGQVWRHTYAMTTSLFVNNDPIDTGRILTRQQELNGDGIASQPFWSLSGRLMMYLVPMAVYPDYRIGTYVEDLSPLGTSPDNGGVYPGAFLDPHPNLGGTPDRVDVNFG